MQTETGFGTGLRAHLGHRRDGTQPAEQPDAPLETACPKPADLARAEEELEQRARRLVAAEARLAQRKRLLEQQARAARAARDVLRERVERDIERLWGVFAEALEATRPDGRPDFEARLLAVRALLAEAYPGSERTQVSGVTAAEDELREPRRRKAERRSW